MIEVRQTDVFARWFSSLKDRTAQLRIDRLGVGLFGDAKYFSGIGELRVDYGPAIASTFSSGAMTW